MSDKIDYTNFRRDVIEFKKTTNGRFMGKNYTGKVIFPDAKDTLIQTAGTYEIIIYREFEKYIFCLGEKRLS